MAVRVGLTWTFVCMTADIKEATRAATRNMIEFLCAEKGLTREEAYMLCSVAGDLRMHEVVRLPDACRVVSKSLS